MKKRLVYWLTPTAGNLTRERAALLSARDCDVRFFQDPPALLAEFSHQRAPVIVLSDEGGPEDVQAVMARMATAPETYGVRLVLAVQSMSPDVLQSAYALGFRDIIPLDLDPAIWLKRFIFSTAGSAVPFSHPHPMMTLNAIAAVAVPARVIWAGPTRIRVETRMAAPVGAKLQMAGRLANYLGMRAITLTVQEYSRTNLRYRFGEAMVCEWSVPQTAIAKRNLLLDHLRKMDVGTACRAFCIVQTPEIRADLLDLLRAPRFEVAMALNKKSIVEEPKYFSPQIVLIEDRICSDENWGYLEELNTTLDRKIPFVVIGTEADFARLRLLAGSRKVIPLPRVKPTLPMMIVEKYLENDAMRLANGAPDDAFVVHGDSDFSTAEIKVPARLRQIHPLAAVLALPYKVGNFGLCRVEAPFLRQMTTRTLMAKITDSYDDPRAQGDGFKHLIESAVINLDQKERMRFAEKLAETIQRALLKGKLEVPQEDREEDEEAAAPQSMSVPISMQDVETAVAVGEDFNRDPRREVIDWSKALEALRPIIIFLVVTLSIFGLIGFVTFRVAPNFERSGSQYSDQLKQFQSKKSPTE